MKNFLTLGKISLRSQFLVVMVSLLFLAVVSYLVLAINLFSRDKTTYIYDGNATIVSTLAAETEAKLQSIVKTMRLIGVAANQSFETTQQRNRELDYTQPGADVTTSLRDDIDHTLSHLVCQFLQPFGR